MSNAKLAYARFGWAHLAHANLLGATGVVGAQFARADLTGAQLPTTVHFGALDTAAEVAQGSAKLFVTMLLVCAYSWLTINSTLDAKLLTDTAVSQLPILNAQIPIVNFYALVPLVLVGLSIVAMLQAQRLWAAVAAAPAATPDGMATADRASAWLIGAWAAGRLARPGNRSLSGPSGNPSGGWLGTVQVWLAVIIGWWLVPITVAWFWARYLHRHDWTVTLIQLGALTAGATAAAAFLALADTTLPRSPKRTSPGRASRAMPDWVKRLLHVSVPEPLRPYLASVAIALGVPLVFGTASYAAINGVYHRADSGGFASQTADDRPAQSLERGVPALQARIPQLMTYMGLRPYAQLAETEVSTRLDPTAMADSVAVPKASGARLVGADLRFASAERVFLALGDLRQTNMLGADLWSADLRGANITGASFVGALMYDVDLRKARAAAAPTSNRVDTLANATGVVVIRDTLLCGGTQFTAANMRYARFGAADVRGASFDDGLLQGATFAKARLQGASFTGADLDGADFRGAYGLRPEQILAARHVDALYDSTFLTALRARGGARLAGYDAQAIAAENERERLSGEDEPDSVSPSDRRARDELIRIAFVGGTASSPSKDLIDQWIARGRKVPGSTDAVPYGCVVTRNVVQLRRPGA